MAENPAETPVVGVPTYCSQPPRTAPVLPPGASPDRERAILVGGAKWVNGTVLHYCFLNEPGAALDATQLDEIRRAFQEWKDVGIGLEFREVTRLSEAEVRISLRRGDGSWSYVGRDVLGIPPPQPTMRFGWSLTDTPHGKATARHEIGHTLGFAHEHQNPFAGIEWDEEKVYRSLGGPPNNWSREKTFHNILRKLSTDEVEGSTWDPLSVMEYPFPAGLIIRPEQYRNGIPDPVRISEQDKTYARRWYPVIDAKPPELHPLQSVELGLASGEQADFTIEPAETRTYEMGTFGSSDFVMVLFEDIDGELRYYTGTDDSATNGNGRLKAKLFQGRHYVLRARLYSIWGPGKAALMCW
ncbi:M12 family metallopeptidase [Streptomyces sp. NPDC004244]|uniref:M12 family metallopeptidase n=1 Tax=Streptomyces sp. NPDC101206 TaxID=3366128 RepID=UPI0038081659